MSHQLHVTDVTACVRHSVRHFFSFVTAPGKPKRVGWRHNADLQVRTCYRYSVLCSL